MSSQASTIDEKINKLKQEISELEEKKAKLLRNLEKIKKQIIIVTGRKNFDTYRGLERHGWEEHPIK